MRFVGRMLFRDVSGKVTRRYLQLKLNDALIAMHCMLFGTAGVPKNYLCVRDADIFVYFLSWRGY